MPRKLKVYRTAVGFRDAYVAAPSRAAALRAWGTEKDLFVRGAAEEVSDDELAADPLSKPGEVVYRTRGGLAEQVAALGKLPRNKPPAREPEEEAKRPAARAKAKRPQPRPSRSKLDAAETAIKELQDAQNAAEAEMRERERALASERTAMEDRFAKKAEALRAKAQQARAAYEEALRRWEP